MNFPETEEEFRVLIGVAEVNAETWRKIAKREIMLLKLYQSEEWIAEFGSDAAKEAVLRARQAVEERKFYEEQVRHWETYLQEVIGS